MTPNPVRTELVEVLPFSQPKKDRASTSSARTGREPEAGFTLVEMLVVLAVIGVAAGATALGIGAATRAPSAEAQAHRLAATVQQAADRAMVDDRALALAWDAKGYGIIALDGGPIPAERTTLPAGMTLAVSGAASPAPLADGAPFVAAIASGTDRWRIGYDGLRAAANRVPTG